MTIVLVGHAVIGVALLLAAPRLRRAAFTLGALPMLATLVFAASQAGVVVDGRVRVERTGWVGALDLELVLRLDAFALLMIVLVSGIGVAVMAYGASYFPSETRSARTAGLLVLFAGAMLGVVTADNLAILYAAWELTSITSFLLIGGKHESATARGAALHALLVTGAGGLALLGGFVLLAQEAGTWSLHAILASPPTGPTVGVALALVLVGILTKSAQYPTHAWLPAAMAAPTPISAYLHSATMVKAGIYLAARFAPAFAAFGAWRPAVVTIGLVTMIAGGLRALRQHDLKLLLAMGTVGQLGFLLVLFGVGQPAATLAGIALLIAHALFKSTLFLVVGIIDHQAGTRDRRELAGFGPGWRTVRVVTVIAAASMAGLPPVTGFVAKEAAFDAFAHEGPWGVVTLGGLVIGSVLTVAYTTRFASTVLRRHVDGEGPPPPATPFVAPAVVLAGLTVVGGVAASPLLDWLASPAAASLHPDAAGLHLALWHGVGLALLLSALTFSAGALLVAGRDRVERWLHRLAPRRDAGDAYLAAVRALNTVAMRTTGVVQSGSLPVYIAVVLLTAVIVPGVVLLQAPSPGWPAFANTPAHVLLAAIIMSAAVATATARRRFSAVVLLGVVGFGMGVVFVMQGAPDLAVTQFAVETLLVVAFVLVLRFLPSRFEWQPPAMEVGPRLLVAGTVAVAVFGLALLSAGSLATQPVGRELTARSLEEAEGRNAVNVVLVDFRGLDTLGEISVLAAAAIGVVALGRAGRRTTEATDAAPVEEQHA